MLNAVVVALAAPFVVTIGPNASALQIQAKIAVGLAHRASDQRLDVTFAPGEYFLDRTLEISASNVRLLGRSTTLSGGVALTRWQPISVGQSTRFPVAARSSIQVADIPTGIPLGKLTRRGFSLSGRAAHSELFADGQPLTLARYPNLDAPNGGWITTGTTSGERSFAVGEDRPTRWQNLADAWAYGYWHYDWADSVEPIDKFDPITHTLSLRPLPAEPRGALDSFGLEKGRRFFYLNVPEELDQAGEYWVDTAARKVYAWLPANAKQIRLTGIDAPIVAVANASNVTLTGISLEGTRGTALRVQNANQFLMAGGTVRNVGGAGVQISGGQSSGLRDVEVTGCGETGVSLDGGNFDTLTPSQNYVENCLIHRVSRWCRTYCPAVLLNGVGQRITGCTLSDLPHNAVLFGGNDHVIERNDIKRVCLETGDSGAIYAGRNPTTRGTVIKHNRFREIEPHTNTEGNYSQVMSVYLDDCQCGISVIGNVFESRGAAIMIGGGRDNIVTGNVFLNNQPSIHFDQRAKGWAKGEFAGGWGYLDFLQARPVQSEAWRKRYPALARDAAAGADFGFAKGNVVAGNVQVGPQWISYLDGLTERDLDYRDNRINQSAKTVAEAIKLIPAGYGKIDLKQIGRR